MLNLLVVFLFKNIFSRCLYFLWRSFLSVLYSCHLARAWVSMKTTTKQNKTPLRLFSISRFTRCQGVPKSCCCCWVPKTQVLVGTEKDIKHETHSNSRPRPQYAVGGVHLRHVCLICVCKQHEERRKNKDGIINSQKGKRKQKKKTAINIFLPLNTAAPLFCH